MTGNRMMVEQHKHRAFGFNHPDFDAGAERSGLTLTAAGGTAMVDGAASVRQSILLLFSTHPGERVMRPRFGCDLRRLIFAPNDDTTAGLAIFYVRRCLERWEPRIQILQLDARRDAEAPTCLRIVLDYRLRRTGQRDQVTYRFDLAGGVSD